MARNRCQIFAVNIRVTAMVLLACAWQLLPDGTVTAKEYQLQKGDVLELFIVGAAELNQKITIDTDGQVTLPLIGELKAEDETLSSFRKRVRERYSQTIYDGGNGKTSLLSARRVLIKVLQYKPVFVIGDIAQPGRIAFRPGLTIKQAIASVGGFGHQLLVMRPVEQAALQRRQTQLRLLIARDEALVWRLRQQIRRIVDSSKLSEDKKPAIDTNRFQQTERRLLARSHSNFEIERAQLKSTIQQSRIAIQNLEKKYDIESAAALEDEKSLASMRSLRQRKIVTNDRLGDARRFALLSASRALQTQIAIDRSNQRLDELKDRFGRLAIQAEVTLLKELRDANASLLTNSAELASIAQQLEARPANVSWIVKLTQTNGTETTIVDLDDHRPLSPGDVLEVVAHTPPFSGSPEN